MRKSDGVSVAPESATLNFSQLSMAIIDSQLVPRTREAPLFAKDFSVFMCKQSSTRVADLIKAN